MTHTYSSTRPQPVAKDYGCRYFGIPHDLKPVHETMRITIKRCAICNAVKRFKKGYLGRSDNRAYLEAHARNFAQPTGRTKRIWHRINDPVKLRIIVH